jgi:hypothetical protein
MELAVFFSNSTICLLKYRCCDIKKTMKYGKEEGGGDI